MATMAFDKGLADVKADAGARDGFAAAVRAVEFVK